MNLNRCKVPYIVKRDLAIVESEFDKCQIIHGRSFESGFGWVVKGLEEDKPRGGK